MSGRAQRAGRSRRSHHGGDGDDAGHAAAQARSGPRRAAGSAGGGGRLGARRLATVATAVPAFRGRSEAASVYPGVQNLLLAARALGLAATLTTWHLALEPEFKAVLGVPRSVKTFAMIPVGWPRGNFGPVGRPPAAEGIHPDRWEPRGGGRARPR